MHIGPEARILAVNEGARRLFGDQIVGRHHVAIIRQPMLLDAIEACQKDRTSREARYLSTEARRDMTWIAHVRPTGDVGGVLVVLEDRTATEEAGQMRRDFVANVSHELKTPLTALLGFIETLQGAARKDPEAQARFLQIMEREAHRMNRLVDDLMSLNRVESEERVRPSARVDLAAQTLSALRALAPLAERHDITIETRGLDAPVMVLGAADQLAQVVTNLVENAIKYAGRGKRVTVGLVPSAHDPMVMGPAAILSVSDTGAGVAPEEIPRLTERFYRVDTHRSRALGGTGLGLAIVKHILNRHRGRLEIDSAPGQGATFRVLLPVVI